MTHAAVTTLILFAGLGPATDVDAETVAVKDGWQVGLHLGELPWDGSFKLGFHAGYQFNDYIYLGFSYQIPDRISRGNSSFNAQATGLSGLVSSREVVGQRMYLQARLRPHRLSPYLSLGLVYNDRDTETLRFDDRLRRIGEGDYEGTVTIVQSRPPGLRPALGLGYEYTFNGSLSVYTEWSGWWLFGAPTPDVEISGVPLSESDAQALTQTIVSEFESSPFNAYHIFQLGLGYRF